MKTTLSLLLTLLVATGAVAQDVDPYDDKRGSSDLVPNTLDGAALGQELRVMQHLLAKAVQRNFVAQRQQRDARLRQQGLLPQQFPGPFTSPGLFPSHRGSHMYLPGVGPVFKMAFNVPMRVAEKPAPKKSATADAWDEAKRELELSGKSKVSHALFWAGKRRRLVVDQQALEATIARLLKTLGKHAGRMESIADDEHMFIVATLSGISPQGELSSRPRKQTLVLQVGKRDLLAYGEGEIKMKKLRQRARLTRY